MPNPIRLSVIADGDSAKLALSKVVTGATAAVTALTAVGVAATREAIEQEQSIDRVTAALGANAQETARIAKTSSKLYQDAYGESFEEVTSAVEAVRSSFRSLGTGPELQAVSRQALDVASTFGYDLPRAVSVAQTAVRSGLAKDATEALDLITAASQKVPAALRENVLDAADEYAPFFADLGYTGSQAFATIAAGAAKGQFGIDKAGDAIKEFTIRSTDMSTSTVGAYDRIGLNAREMADRILAGGDTAQRATGRIVEGLLSIESPSKRAESAIALFGTPLEDLGVKQIPSFLRSLQDGQRGLGDFEGAAARAGKALNDNTGARLTEFRRKVTQTIVDEVGKRALPVLDDLARAGIEVTESFKTDGFDGAVAALEKLTGTQGKLTPIVDQGRDALDSVLRVVEELAPAFLDAVAGLSPLLSPLSLLDDAASAVAAVLEAMPDGLITVGIQAAILSRALPLLTGATAAAGGAFVTTRARLAQMRAEMSYATTAAGRARIAYGYMGGAARSAAGIGGLLALTSGAGEANGALKTLTNVGGGALLGFSVAGPIGGAIGAGAGALLSLKDAFVDAGKGGKFASDALARAEGFQAAEEGADKLREALIGVVNAYGETSRAAVEASFVGDDGKLTAEIQALRDLEVSMDTIVSAALGQADAQRVVNAAYNESLTPLRENLRAAREVQASLEEAATSGELSSLAVDPAEYEAATAAVDDAKAALDRAAASQTIFGERVSDNRAALQEHRVTVQNMARDLGITVQQYRKFPKAVRTDVEDGGLRQTARDAIRLINQYKGLQRFDRIRAVVSAPGVELSARQVANLARQYRLTPNQVRTLVRLQGGVETTRDVRKVMRELQGLDRVETNLPGVPRGTRRATDQAAGEARRGADRINSALDDIGRNEPGFDGLRRGTEESLRDTRQVAERGGREAADAAEKPLREARADLQGMRSSLPPQLAAIQGNARSGGVAIGAALKAGIISGFAGTASALASQAGAAVSAAIAEARSRARVNSPSKETEYIGRMLGEGLPLGMLKEHGKARKAGRDLIAAALSGARVSTGAGILAGIGRLSEVVAGTYEDRTDAAEAARERRLREAETASARALRETKSGLDDELRARKERLRERLKGEKLEKAIRAAEEDRDRAVRQAERASEQALRERQGQIRRNSRERLAAIAAESRAAARLIKDEDDRLRANAARQDKVAERLRKWVDTLKSRREEARQYAAAIEESFVSYGSVVGLGVLEGEDGTVSASLLLDQLEDRVARAQRFAALIESFRDDRGPKLNETALQELIDKGPEAALATAEALAAGGAATINQVNDLTKDLADAGAGLGAAMVEEFKQAGINAAEGMVEGLRSRQAELDKVAERLARSLIRKVKEALGIKSPSREFRGIADDTVGGLLGRLKESETYVERQGSDLADALQTGFAKPELIAQMKATAVSGGYSSGAEQTLTINLRVTAEQMSQLQQGRAVVGQVGVARAAGVRTLAIGGRV